MRKRVIIISCFLVFAILLCSCDLNSITTTIPKELKTSEGMKNLGERTVNAFEDYSSAKKSKKTYLKKLYEIHEQEDDLFSVEKKYPGDSYLDTFIDEVYEDSINDSAEKKDIELPINDIKKVLNGTYNFKKKIYSVPHENDDLTFYLTKDWKTKKGESKDDDMYYTYLKSGNSLLLYPFVYKFDIEEPLNMQEDCGADLVANACGFDKGDKLKYSTIYKSRKLNYFDIYTGSYISKGEKENVLVAIVNSLGGLYSTDSYLFYFVSEDKFGEKTLHELLDNVDSLDNESIYDVDEKYEEYFENH